MIKPGAKELLKDARVLEEIKRHKWIESEKVGRDIGFERAADDWLKRFSEKWIQYNLTQAAEKANISRTKKPQRII